MTLCKSRKIVAKFDSGGFYKVEEFGGTCLVYRFPLPPLAYSCIDIRERAKSSVFCEIDQSRTNIIIFKNRIISFVLNVTLYYHYHCVTIVFVYTRIS